MIVRPLTLAALAAIACSACGIPREPIGPPVCDDPSDLAYWRDVPPPAWWLAECPFDAGIVMPDGGVPDDAALDAGSDAGVDASVADAGDAAIEMMDAGPDAGPRDAGSPDSGPPDAGSDAGVDAGPSPTGCADGTVDQAYPSPDMVGCNGSRDQCTADTLCGSGWHLCTYGEYEARGGGFVPATAGRWLAGCLRAGNCSVLGSITGGTCGDCSVEVGPNTSFGSTCPGAVRVETDACPAGVVADGASARLDGEADCAMAGIRATDQLLGASCCR